MNLIGGLVGGVVGAIIGAVIWATISYFTNHEVGYVAWGIGALAGGGVALGSRNQAGAVGGVLAVVLALLGIAGGKWGSVELSFRAYLDPDQMAIGAIADDIEAERTEAGRPSRAPHKKNSDSIADEYAADVWAQATARWNSLPSDQQNEARQFPPIVHQDFMVSYIANSVLEEHEAQGEKLAWPTGYDADSAWRKAHYPAVIWQDAEKRWAGMSAAEQSDYRAKVLASESREFAAAMSALHSQASSHGFMASIGLFDILWVILAIGTAFKLGSAETAATSA